MRLMIHVLNQCLIDNIFRIQNQNDLSIAHKTQPLEVRQLTKGLHLKILDNYLLLADYFIGDYGLFGFFLSPEDDDGFGGIMNPIGVGQPEKTLDVQHINDLVTVLKNGFLQMVV